MTTVGLVEPGFEDPDLTPVGSWLPARYTPSLTGTEDFRTDGDRLLEVVRRHWSTPESREFLADPWQVWLIRHLLELYPDDWPVPELRGQLRYRRVVVSIARQNGKSLIAAILAFYFLAMHVRGPRVVGLASRDRQARIVYDRVRYAVDNSPVLRTRINATASRGITLRDGTGLYQTLPADEDAVQGEPVTGGIYDELHLGKPGVWSAIVKGARSKVNAMLVGITTAGDDDSDLLIQLYDEGELALENPDDPDSQRFGFFVWEAASDELTEANVIAASPAVACGRIPLGQAMADARAEWRAPADKTGITGRDRVIRYVLNRFVQGGANTWASLPAWRATATLTDRGQHAGAGVVFAADRTRNWEWLSVTATYRLPDDRLATELVASLPDMDDDATVELLDTLARAHPGSAVALPRATLSGVAKELKDRGTETWSLTAGEEAEAAATAKAAIARRTITHPGDPLLSVQMVQARRKDTAEGWRISRGLSTGDVDAVIATVAGLYVATLRPEQHQQIF